jgi:hypothetical protein
MEDAITSPARREFAEGAPSTAAAPVVLDIPHGQLRIQPDPKLRSSGQALLRGSGSRMLPVGSTDIGGKAENLEEAGAMLSNMLGWPRENASVLSKLAAHTPATEAMVISLYGRRVRIPADAIPPLRSLVRNWVRDCPHPEEPGPREDEPLYTIEVRMCQTEHIPLVMCGSQDLPTPGQGRAAPRSRIRRTPKECTIRHILGVDDPKYPLATLLLNHLTYFRELKEWFRLEALQRQVMFLPRLAALGVDLRAQTWITDPVSSQAESAMSAANRSLLASPPRGGVATPHKPDLAVTSALQQLTVSLSPSANSPIPDFLWNRSLPQRRSPAETTASSGGEAQLRPLHSRTDSSIVSSRLSAFHPDSGSDSSPPPEKRERDANEEDEIPPKKANLVFPPRDLVEPVSVLMGSKGSVSPLVEDAPRARPPSAASSTSVGPEQLTARGRRRWRHDGGGSAVGADAFGTLREDAEARFLHSLSSRSRRRSRTSTEDTGE